MPAHGPKQNATERYQKRTEQEREENHEFTLKELDGAYKRLKENNDPRQVRRVPIESAKIVIFSDHHRGMNDGADDFRRCAVIYRAALRYYFELGYDLILLGDVEELWERKWPQVESTYADILKLELEFALQNRLWRVFGNHDLIWASDADPLTRYLNNGKVYESLRLDFTHAGTDAGRLFLVHGHQGKDYSAADIWAVRNLWAKIQEMTGIGSAPPSKNYELRDEHERSYHEWAFRYNVHSGDSVPLGLIAGHTHRPVFASATHEMSLAAEIEKLRLDLTRALPESEAIALRQQLASLAAQLEYTRGINGGNPATMPKDSAPVYFNTGCCCFWDGDITGIEITGDHMRLVRFPDNNGAPLPQNLRGASLTGMFNRIKTKNPPGP